MNIYSKFNTQPFYTKLAAVLISIFLLGYFVILGKELLSPLIFSCLFSIMLLPVAKWFETRCRLPRSAACMLAVIILLSVVALLLFVIGSQLSGLSSDWPLFKTQLNNSVDDLQQWISTKFHVNEGKQVKFVKSATSKLMDSGTEVVGATLVSLSSMLLFLVFTFIYTFLFLVYRNLIMKFLLAVFMEENSAVVYDVVEQVQYIIRKYIVGLMLEMGIVAAIVSITFSIMGVKYAILLGIITGLFNLVPYIGIFTALVISALITFATAAAAGKVILVVVALVIVHLLDSNLLLPLIVGSKVKINALVTIIGVITGEMIWGIPGMFLSIPIIAVLKIIFDRVESMKPWGIILGDEEKKLQEIQVLEAVHTAEDTIVKKMEGD